MQESQAFQKCSHWLDGLQGKVVAIAITFGIAATAAFAGEIEFEQCRYLFVNGNPPAIQHPEVLARDEN